ncbi:hypothetical protein AB0892_21065, partial [Streptomyces sp. NPDC005409]
MTRPQDPTPPHGDPDPTRSADSGTSPAHNPTRAGASEVETGHAPNRTPSDPARAGDGGAGCVPGRSPQGVEHTAAAPPDPSPRSAPEETPRRAPRPA